MYRHKFQPRSEKQSAIYYMNSLLGFFVYEISQLLVVVILSRQNLDSYEIFPG